MKSSSIGSMGTGADKEGANEKSAEEKREVEREREMGGGRQRERTGKEFEWAKESVVF